MFKHFCKYKWCLLNYNFLLATGLGALIGFMVLLVAIRISSRIERYFSLRIVTSGLLYVINLIIFHLHLPGLKSVNALHQDLDLLTIC